MLLRVMCLLGTVLLLVTATASAEKPYEGPRPVLETENATCNRQDNPNLCIPFDDTWQVVTFGAGWSCAGPANPADPCQRNDDDYAFELPLGFTFDLYGTPQTSVFINNNGNLSFGAGYCTYTPTGFPVDDYPMVAAFWGDVDTRGATDGVAWIKHGPNYLAITWDHVGYYNTHSDLQNTVQLIISDGTFAPMGIGNNVCFCYDDMQWTTGDASGGSGGFGGYGATVGVNKGNGIDFIQFGRFDHAGTDYDGPGGGYDGVSWLDGQRFCFYVGGETNLPPAPIDFPPGNTATVLAGTTLDLSVGFIGPEIGQTVHTDVDAGGLPNFSYISTDGNPSTIDMTFSPTMSQAGSHVVHFTAADDYIPGPPGVTELDLTLVVELPPVVCRVEPTELDFGSVSIGDHADLDFAITNDGGQTMVGALSGACDDFSIVSGEGPYSLDGGQSLVVTVRFEPASEGSKTCVIETGALCSEVTCAGIAENPLVSVYVDIKPGSCPNPLNPKTKGILPAAVLGDESFDAMEIDPATVRLTSEGVSDGVEPLRWSYEDVATPFDGVLCDCHELGADGYMDLTLKFSVEDLVQTLGLEIFHGETVPLMITGSLLDGLPIVGSDCMRVLGSHTTLTSQDVTVQSGRTGFESGDQVTLLTESSVIFSVYAMGGEKMSIDVFDVQGRVVKHLFSGEMSAGSHSIVWDMTAVTGARVPAGIYFLRLSTDFTSMTRKVILVE